MRPSMHPGCCGPPHSVTPPAGAPRCRARARLVRVLISPRSHLTVSNSLVQTCGSSQGHQAPPPTAERDGGPHFSGPSERLPSLPPPRSPSTRCAVRCVRARLLGRGAVAPGASFWCRQSRQPATAPTSRPLSHGPAPALGRAGRAPSRPHCAQASLRRRRRRRAAFPAAARWRRQRPPALGASLPPPPPRPAVQPTPAVRAGCAAAARGAVTRASRRCLPAPRCLCRSRPSAFFSHPPTPAARPRCGPLPPPSSCCLRRPAPRCEADGRRPRVWAGAASSRRRRLR